MKINNETKPTLTKDLKKIKALIFRTINKIGDDVTKYIPSELWHDREFILQLLCEPGTCNYFEQLDPELQNDREFILQALQVNPHIFKLLSQNFRNDTEIVLTAIAHRSRITGWKVLSAMSEELQNNRDFIIQALTKNLHLAKKLPPQFYNDFEIARMVLQHHGHYLELFSPSIKKDYNIVKLAVSSCGMALLDTDVTLQNDYDLVLIAARDNGEILCNLGQSYYDDEAVILAAITSTDWSLKQMAKNFAFASLRLKNDHAFILRAISDNGYIYPFLSIEFQQDSGIICSAAKTNLDIILYLDNKLRIEQELVLD